jgi:hypothetical protein
MLHALLHTWSLLNHTWHPHRRPSVSLVPLHLLPPLSDTLNSYSWIVFAAPYIGSAQTTSETHCCLATDIRYCCQACLPMHCLAMDTLLLHDVTHTSCCAIQAFTELSPSNLPIQSTTLTLHACPEASVAQQFLRRAGTPHYFILCKCKVFCTDLET